MKESRLIIIFSMALAIITTIIAILMHCVWPNLIDYIGILTNIHCGIIVGLVTSICQYFVQKRKKHRAKKLGALKHLKCLLTMTDFFDIRREGINGFILQTKS